MIIQLYLIVLGYVCVCTHVCVWERETDRLYALFVFAMNWVFLTVTVWGMHFKKNYSQIITQKSGLKILCLMRYIIKLEICILIFLVYLITIKCLDLWQVGLHFYSFIVLKWFNSLITDKWIMLNVDIICRELILGRNVMLLHLYFGVS